MKISLRIQPHSWQLLELPKEFLIFFKLPYPYLLICVSSPRLATFSELQQHQDMAVNTKLNLITFFSCISKQILYYYA